MLRNVEGIGDRRTEFFESGVTFLTGALATDWIDLLRMGIQRVVNNIGPYGKVHFKGEPGEFLDDRCDYFTTPEYRIFLHESPLVDLASEIFDSSEVRLYVDQTFIKEGGFSKRTPFHQDISSFCGKGTQFAAFWITVDPVPAEDSLELVKGSHLGPMYSRTYSGTYARSDAPAPEFSPDAEPMPDIEADPASFDLVSYAIEPGDVVMFHPAVLHGGAGIRDARRRTVSFRLFGDDVTFVPPPLGRLEPALPGLLASGLVEGQPLRHSWFPRLYPRTPTSASDSTPLSG
jgi:ectoine hydroxylase-related dioxygenase (phytanoyl-CoA dioxygenase family)